MKHTLLLTAFTLSCTLPAHAMDQDETLQEKATRLSSDLKQMETRDDVPQALIQNVQDQLSQIHSALDSLTKTQESLE